MKEAASPCGVGEEIEYKYRVSKPDDLDKVIMAAAAQQVKTVRQVNAFFDTQQHNLNGKKITVRLRKENESFILGAKGQAVPDLSGRQTRKEEWEAQIEPDVAEAMLQGKEDPLKILAQKQPCAEALVKSIREELADKKLQYVGFFVSFRQKVQTNIPDLGELNIELDTSIFQGDLVHYEIEVEVPSQHKDHPQKIDEAMKQILKRAGVEGRTGPPKAKRFFNLLEGKKAE
jgi:uncharacterized protein YjbK